MVYYVVSVLFLLFFWCPCMAINVSIQYNGGLLPDTIGHVVALYLKPTVRNIIINSILLHYYHV